MSDEKQERQPEDSIGFMRQIEQEADESLHPLLQKIVDNIKVIGIALVAIILAVGGYSWYKYNQQTELQAAREKLGHIRLLSDNDQKIKELESFLQKAPADLTTAARLEIIREYENRKSYDNCAEQWEKLSLSNDKELKTIALIGLANSNARLGKFDEALQAIQKAQENAGEYYKTSLIGLTGNIAEMGQKWDVALTAYETLKDDLNITNKGFIEYKINTIKQKTQG